MEKRNTCKGRLTDCRHDDFVPGSMAERIGLVWPLTEEVTSLSPKHNAKQRLQRHVAYVYEDTVIRFQVKLRSLQKLTMTES